MNETGERSGRPTVTIVGGGLAGMAAAAALSGAAVDVRLYESKRSTGGRAGSFLDAASGSAIDYCQHVAMGCCTNFAHLMHWSGLNGCFQRSSGLTFLAGGSPPSAFRLSRLLPAPLHLAPALGQLHFLDPAERRQIRRGLWRLMRMRPPDDSLGKRAETMGDWLRNSGQSADVIAKFWNMVLASALGDHVDVVALAPARKVFVDGFLRARGASDLLIPRQPLSTLFGQRLPTVLGQRGVSVHMGTRVRRCDVDDQGRFQLWIDSRPPILADDLILAVPWHVVPRLIDGTRLSAAVERLGDVAQIPSSPISGIHLWLDRQITNLPHAVIVDRLSQWVFRPPTEQGPPAPTEHYYQVVVSAAHDLRGRSAAETCAEVMADLASVFPEAGPMRCLRSRVVTDPTAVFSITPEVERVRPTTTTGRQGFYLAGDWVRTGWPATMEGAVLSGYRAAEQVLARHGQPTAKVVPAPTPGLLARCLIR